MNLPNRRYQCKSKKEEESTEDTVAEETGVGGSGSQASTKGTAPQLTFRGSTGIHGAN